MAEDIKHSADADSQLDAAAAAVVNSLKAEGDQGEPTAQPTNQPQEPPASGQQQTDTAGSDGNGSAGSGQEPFDWFQVMTGGFGTAPVPPPSPTQSGTPSPLFAGQQQPQQPTQPAQQPSQQTSEDDWNAFLSAQSPFQVINEVVERAVSQHLPNVLPNMLPQMVAAVQQQLANQAALAQVAQRYGERYQLLRDFAARRLQSAPHQYLPLASNPSALYSKLFEDAEKDAIAQARMLYELQQRDSGASASAAVSGAPAKREPRAQSLGTSRGVSEEIRQRYNKAIESGDIDTAIELMLRHAELAPAKGG